MRDVLAKQLNDRKKRQNLTFQHQSNIRHCVHWHSKSLTVRGFIQTEFVDQQQDTFLKEAAQWIAEGKLKWREDVVDGLAQAPEAFIGLLEGRNFGKLIVRLNPQ